MGTFPDGESVLVFRANLVAVRRAIDQRRRELATEVLSHAEILTANRLQSLSRAFATSIAVLCPASETFAAVR